MPYNIKNLSLKSLEKVFLVLDDIRYNMEIQNKTSWLDMGRVAGISGVPKIEHRQIMQSLLENTDFMEEIHYGGGDCCLDIKVEKFNQFLQKVSDRMKELKGKQIIKKDSSEKELTFDKNKSVLIINGYKIQIAVRDKKTVAHDILEYILVDKHENLDDDFPYAEIAFDKFGDEKYSKDKMAWRKYYSACMDIKDKIIKQTANAIDDFLIYNSSQQGRVKINPKYLS
jgi:hypothetical protein